MLTTEEIVAIAGGGLILTIIGGGIIKNGYSNDGPIRLSHSARGRSHSARGRSHSARSRSHSARGSTKLSPIKEEDEGDDEKDNSNKTGGIKLNKTQKNKTHKKTK